MSETWEILCQRSFPPMFSLLFSSDDCNKTTFIPSSTIGFPLIQIRFQIPSISFKMELVNLSTKNCNFKTEGITFLMIQSPCEGFVLSISISVMFVTNNKNLRYFAKVRQPFSLSSSSLSPPPFASRSGSRIQTKTFVILLAKIMIFLQGLSLMIVPLEPQDIVA